MITSRRGSAGTGTSTITRTITHFAPQRRQFPRGDREERSRVLKAPADVSGTPSEISLNKRNYRQAKRQKEERRSERATAADVSTVTDSAGADREPTTAVHIPES